MKQCGDRMLGTPTWNADTQEIKMEDRVEPYRLVTGNCMGTGLYRKALVLIRPSHE